MERKIKWIKRSFFVFIIEGDILRLKNLNNNLQVKHISNQLLDKNIRTPCRRNIKYTKTKKIKNHKIIDNIGDVVYNKCRLKVKGKIYNMNGGKKCLK